MLVGGCRQQASVWDEVQQDSQGQTAQQSSAERVNGAVVSGDDDDLGGPPPFTPGKPQESTGGVDWNPGESSSALDQPTTSIDIASLTSGDPLPGSEFNKFFPKQEDPYDMVAKQEKAGFAQYSLRRAGEEIAQLSVTDLRSNPQAAVKFEKPDRMIGGFPAKKDGTKGTTLLVKGRFQVKVRSPQGNLNESDRIEWLERFDLSGIAGLAN